MAETLVERCYFVLKGFSEEIKEGMHEREPKYSSILGLLAKLLESSELDAETDAVLIGHIRNFLSYGAWEFVYHVLVKKTEGIKSRQDYETVLSEMIRLLGRKIKKPVAGREHLSIASKIGEGLNFYKVNLQGYLNEVQGLLSIDISSITSPPFHVKIREGDPRTYLHNPLREEIVFVKGYLIKERFPDYLVPFMKRHKLGLYLCTIETMLGYLAHKHAKSGVLNLIAVTKKKYIGSLDDRTLFIVLEKDGNNYIPVEMCFGGILHQVPLIGMQTLAFVVGLRPDELHLVSVNDEFEKSQHLQSYVFDPSKVAFVGWWHEAFECIIAMYFGQNLRRVLAEFVFYLADFLAERKADIQKRTLFAAAKAEGFALEEATGAGLAKLGRAEFVPFNIGLRTRFYDFLQTPDAEGFVEKSQDYLIDVLIGVVTLTSFDPDPEKNGAFQMREIEDLTSRLRVGVAEKRIAFFRTAKERLVSHFPEGELPWSEMARRKAVFAREQYFIIRDELLKIDATFRKAAEEFIESQVKMALAGGFPIEIGGIRGYVFPRVLNEPIDIQVDGLIKTGFNTFIFYGTAGGIIGEEVKGVPGERLAIPEFVYFHPAKYVIDPAAYQPIPFANLLLSDVNAARYFKTDNFYKTHSIFVASQFQEHAGWLEAVKFFFGKKELTVEMDIAPIVELCTQKGVGLGIILFVTDELKGINQRLWLKGYNMRHLILSLFRAYEGRELVLRGQTIEVGMNGLFQTIAQDVLRRLLA